MSKERYIDARVQELVLQDNGDWGDLSEADILLAKDKMHRSHCDRARQELLELGLNISATVKQYEDTRLARERDKLLIEKLSFLGGSGFVAEEELNRIGANLNESIETIRAKSDQYYHSIGRKSRLESC